MTWYTGTATDFKDLLLAVKTNAVASGWTVSRYVTGSPSPYTDELDLQCPGFGTGYEGYFGIRTYQDLLNNYFCWESNAFTSFDSGREFDAQINVSPKVYTRLWNASINYWMSISDRRIIVIAKCSNTYHSFYGGFIDPFSDPTEYPYPFVLASDSISIGPFGAVENTTRSIAMPGYGAAWLRDPSGVWCRLAVYDQSGGDPTFVSYAENQMYTIWPYNTVNNSGSGVNSQWYAPNYATFEPQPGTTDVLPMLNCYIFALFDKGGVLGVLEGVYWVPGNALSAEQELTIGDDTYQVFIDVSRSIETPTTFYAIQES